MFWAFFWISKMELWSFQKYLRQRKQRSSFSVRRSFGRCHKVHHDRRQHGRQGTTTATCPLYHFMPKNIPFLWDGQFIARVSFFASLNWTAKITARSMVKIRPGGWQISWEGFCLCTHSWETQILWSAGASRWPGWEYGDLTRMHAICMLVC